MKKMLQKYDLLLTDTLMTEPRRGSLFVRSLSGFMCILLLSVGNEDNIKEKSDEKSWLK